MKYLVTGGTGSLGSIIVEKLLQRSDTNLVVVFSRDEFKQSEMARVMTDKRLKFCLGDIRDLDRLQECCEGIDFVIHCAALKRMDADNHNVDELVKTNIIGSQNLVRAAKNSRIIFISTDKAYNPTCLYGSTKLVAENVFRKHDNCVIIRFGNFSFSRGSVIPIFEEQEKEGTITITDPNATRFWVDMDFAADYILEQMNIIDGQMVRYPLNLKSFSIGDLAEVIAPWAKKKIIGLRFGEKLHEEFSSDYSSRNNIMSIKELKELYERTSRLFKGKK